MNEERKEKLKAPHGGHDCATCNEAVELIDETVNLKRISDAWRAFAEALTKCSGVDCHIHCTECADIEKKRQALARIGESV